MFSLETTAGFEFEFSGADIQAIERQLRANNLSCSRPGGWRRSDGSIWDVKTDSSCGYEVATPVLYSYEDLVRAAYVGDLITQAGGRATTSCGFHVHIGVSQFSFEELQNLFRFLLRYEAAFYLLVPGYRKSSQWCKKLSDETVDRIKLRFGNHSRESIPEGSWWHRTWEDKNVWLNGRRFPDIGTLEFRIMPGTLSPAFIMGYVTFLQCVIKAVRGKKIAWGVASSKDDRSLFQTMLGQAGFYGPFTSQEQRDLCVTGRKWAIERFKLASGQLPTGDIGLDLFNTIRQPQSIIIPTVSTRSPFIDRPEPAAPRRPRRPRQSRRTSPQVLAPNSVVTVTEDNSAEDVVQAPASDLLHSTAVDNSTSMPGQTLSTYVSYSALSPTASTDWSNMPPNTTSEYHIS